jgi:hypothetical protein
MESLRQILARFLNIDLSRLRIFRPALARQSQTDHFVSLEITGTNAGASANQLVSGSTAAYVASQDNTLPQIRAVVLDPDATQIWSFASRIGPAKEAIAFYEAQIKATKDAMHAWTLVGIKLKVVKDMRKLISKLIWDSREEALYKK